MERVAESRVRLDGDPSCTTPVELFLLGAGIEVGRARSGLAPVGLDHLVGAGLVEVEDDVVRARVSLLPFEGLWLVADRLNERGVPRGQRVPNTDLSTLLTSSVVSRRHVGSMLDLGTGTGVHALLAARHADAVVGVDINPRAIHYARFNAGLNRVTAADWIEGGFFDRLGDRSFDLVVANPPFIIAPARDDPHRFGGGAGHELSRDVVRGAAQRLRDGGRAHVLCDVGVGAGQTWVDVLREWVDGTGCDALLLRLSTTAPADYALRNHDPRAYPTSRAYEDATRGWLDSYRALGIDAIASVIIVLRRRTSATTWTEAFELAGDPVGDVSAAVDRMFEGIDAFAGRPPEDLLRERLALVDGHELRQRLHRVDGTYRPDDVGLLVPGLPLVGALDPVGVPVLFGLDGTRDLATVMAEVATEYGVPDGDLHAQLLPQLHELGRRGFLRRTAGQP